MAATLGPTHWRCSMEKYGVKKNILHEELRNKEAQLMQEMQSQLTDSTKTASDRAAKEQELQTIRSKITDLDLGKSNTEGL